MNKINYCHVCQPVLLRIDNIIYDYLFFLEAEKENVPINQQSPIKSPAKSQRNVLTMLEQAGIADISEPRLTQTVDLSRRETIDPSRQEAAVDPSRTDKRDSEGSETPLGSLDRTKVSLGDSDKTTDSIRFIR